MVVSELFVLGKKELERRENLFIIRVLRFIESSKIS